MHIGRIWTIFYSILEDVKEVRVSEILPIDDTHKRYGF
ncbi:MAG: plasmid stabilization system [Candidatus Thermoplasmatota archaeon]|nr:plasmid stabilization system [Candidatus Thermoplasmatota archaeon]